VQPNDLYWRSYWKIDEVLMEFRIIFTKEAEESVKALTSAD